MGLTSNKAPPTWADEHDPTKAMSLTKGRKLSAQQGYATKISSPVRKRERVVPSGAALTFLDEYALQHGANPGPGEYYKDDTVGSLSGGRFSKASPLTEIELRQRAASRIPGPSDYEQVLTTRGMPLRAKPVVKFGRSDRTTELDVLQARARKIPGPGCNGEIDKPRPHIGTKFSHAQVPTELDMVMARSRKSPAPHDYGAPAMVLSHLGGQFSSAFPPTALEAVILAKRSVPGPATYERQPNDMGPLVGKVQMARTPSAQDRQIAAARKTPGPGTYAIASTLVKNPGATKWPAVRRRPPPERMGPWTPHPGSAVADAFYASSSKTAQLKTPPTGIAPAAKAATQAATKATAKAAAKAAPAAASADDGDDGSYGDGSFEEE